MRTVCRGSSTPRPGRFAAGGVALALAASTVALVASPAATAPGPLHSTRRTPSGGRVAELRADPSPVAPAPPAPSSAAPASVGTTPAVRFAQQPPLPRLPEELPSRLRMREPAVAPATPPASEPPAPPSRAWLLPEPSAPRESARNAQAEREYARFVTRTIDPEQTLDLIVQRPRILVFRETPTRIYLAQDTIANYDVISEKEIAVVGVAPGRTVLTVWVPDPEQRGEPRVLSYLLQVSEDPGYRVRLEAVYATLEKELNRDFPDSVVRLSLVGDQLIVRGQAKDVVQASQIMRIVREHAPPSRNTNRTSAPTNVAISQTAYTPEGVLQSHEAIESTAAQLAQAAQLEGDANVVNLLQIPGEQQVMLRVTVAEVNRSALRSIGTNLQIRGGSGVAFQSTFPDSDILEQLETGLLTLEGGTLSVTRGDLRLAVNALKQLNLARTLAEPNLVTLHGRPARFQAGGQFPVPAARVGFGSAGQGVDFVPFGVQLQFVPYIVDRDKVRLMVAANVSTRDDSQSTDVGGSQVPGITTRNFQNTVELREGQTLAVAGLIQTNFGANSSRVPFLGDLPVVGRLFKNDATSADEQELVILISPELVHPLDPDECLPLPGADTFEPGDIEFYLKGYLESRRSEDHRSPVRTDWARQRRYHRCESEFLIGPTGHSYGCRDGTMGSGHLGPRRGMTREEPLPPPRK